MPKSPELPHSTDAEETVLGCILKEPMAFAEVAKVIADPAMFYSPKCRIIFECMRELVVANEPLDIVTVVEELSKWESKPHASALEAVGGRSYVLYLTQDIVSTVNITKYSQIVAEKYQFRKIISLAAELGESAYSQRTNPTELIATTTQNLLKVAERREDKEFRRITRFADEVLTHLEAVTRGEKPVGIPFGYERLDFATAGAQNADLIVLGGRPSHGKTSLADNIAQHMCEKGYKVGFFSAETKGTEFSLRTMCTSAQLDSMRLKRGKMTHDDWEKITKAHNKLQSFHYYVDDTAAIDINSLMAKAARAREELGLQVIFIDYLQKLRYPPTFPNKREATNYIVGSTKNLAKSLDLPIVALSQLNRNVDMRVHKAPILSDFKESGDIEQEADLMLAIHRPGLYAAKKKKDNEKLTNLAELHILKQRNGPLDVIPLFFNKVFTRFENMAFEQPEFPNNDPF